MMKNQNVIGLFHALYGMTSG